MPKVSVGMPVRNGGEFVAQAIASVLCQTLDDLELIICDNASDDNTEALSRDAAARDRRVRYVRWDRNLGAAPNFNRSFELSSGEYFKWAAHDDLVEPTFLSKAVRFLDEHHDRALVTSRCVWIDEAGRPLGEHVSPLDMIDSTDVRIRFGQLISLSHGCFDAFGLFRRKILSKTNLIASYVGSDRALLAQIGLYGRMHRIDEVLFYSRDHSGRSIRSGVLRRRAPWWDASLPKQSAPPWWRLLREYSLLIDRAPLSERDRLRCRLCLLQWMRRNWRFLVSDLLPPARGGRTEPVAAAVRRQLTKV